MSKWIKCDDVLKPNGIYDVLVTFYRKDSPNIIRFGIGYYENIYEIRGWRLSELFEDDIGISEKSEEEIVITNWQPLPEPPKE